ncbi:SpoVR family protein [Hazenella sp. IB182357]|uniref:SpoVR family protein n=1 Tax=Polycladospora coralii TaxID=2771432 RepID=A0A926N751_9BACL|nr:SpoVR family protein [Polycladospora coralii]MBD1373091.1 SpoVR family protein [Polycladospora coralii]MBS7529563.1 SpoVR family protein [Polycladospora coralii]
MSGEREKLEYAIEEITEIAKGFGLDFYPMRYEICPADIIYTFGAYGMPTRYSHWSFGKTFHKMKLQYDFNLSKIYELVINSNPCYAFLLKGNTLVQNKLIVAHVLAHCDFFKRNYRFAMTSRDMVENMSNSAERIHQYELVHGKDQVELFLDHVLSIQENIEPNSLAHKKLRTSSSVDQDKQKRKEGPYEDLWKLDRDHASQQKEDHTSKSFPKSPEKDLLLFLMNHSRILEDWQQDILSIIRNEMLYFWPQLETKIMNEGWASYWHIRIMRELDLTEDETIEFARLNSSVLQPSSTSINPYYLGLKMLENIEKRWDHPNEEEMVRYGRKKGQGKAKIFEVREVDTDISFIRNYLTKELVEDLDLYVFAREGNDWNITDKAWENVRDELVKSRINGGHPYIVVKDGDHLKNGELYLIHMYEGMELDLNYMEKTLPHVHAIWGRTVHLETQIEGRPVVFTYNGKKCGRRFL